ncbi:alpha-glucan phosphorylase [Halothiobacillus diazotrophicus]|uniref:Alpha-glucan phosphorylase n=1 Tax=Halothiobacillus diazotrophicus TaxID=1860122 RepID=A0A191ZGY4_9GAMM|nr:alpha-glucan family phosphorylase [Halothiobacillus diazotrophicus]ANJ67144.1 alpha-glucan phosphorylase [Halothiobacillus diazotrophicus]
MNASIYTLEITPRLPARIARLDDLANNLYYSWTRSVRHLFSRIDPLCWRDTEDNPRLFLLRVAQEKLDEAAENPVYLADYDDACRHFDEYLARPLPTDLAERLAPNDLVAYFCAEYGFHESLPIYSGGLGILAGDHCKAVSDLGLPFVGVGLMYRQGYFKQEIDAQGNQIATYQDIDFDTLPITKAVDARGGHVSVALNFPGRIVQAQVWQAQIGRARLLLLDTDIEENRDEDRQITYRLYGGDRRTRIEQEIVLGIGGVRALRALGLSPTAWHINEGHAAFQVIERLRELVRQDYPPSVALEMVAAATVFTTHTPVPAGHDVFAEALIHEYFEALLPELNLTEETFLALGRQPHQAGFNMTALALHGSRQHNGVSAIHGRVAAEMVSAFWPEVPAEENPMTHVTNGVHVDTFLAREFSQLFDSLRRDWRLHLRDQSFWSFVDTIPDERFWSVRCALKVDLIRDVCQRLTRQLESDGLSDIRIDRTLRYLKRRESEVLIVGFARRFATYKRANLLFRDRERLARLLADEQRPIVFLFAGKAHPADEPGKALIREIWQIANEPAFHGRILLLEGYDMALARKLVAGCDVWLNIPEYPLEASGTSGQKASMNGALNLSVADGWWGEGYQEQGEVANGWSIKPYNRSFNHEYCDNEEASDLLTLLEGEVKPMFFKRNENGVPVDWVKHAKVAIHTVLPQFNATRMVCDYITRHYLVAARHGDKLTANGGAMAKDLDTFKRKVRELWPGVSGRLINELPHRIHSHEEIHLEVEVNLNGLRPEEVAVECLFGHDHTQDNWLTQQRFSTDSATSAPPTDAAAPPRTQIYRLAIRINLSGLQNFRLRVVPSHPAQLHPYELGLMKWL